MARRAVDILQTYARRQRCGHPILIAQEFPVALPEAEADLLMSGLQKAADAAQGALPNPKPKAKDTAAKRAARFERLGEFVQAVIATPQGLDELTLRASIVWGGTCRGSLAYQAGEAARKEFLARTRVNHENELESQALADWLCSDQALAPSTLREDVRQKIGHLERMIELKMFGPHVLPLIEQCRIELKGVYYFAKLKEADGCYWLWHLIPTQLKKENSEHDPWLRLLKEGKADWEQISAAISILRQCQDLRCRWAGYCDTPATIREQGKLPDELLAEIPVATQWTNQDDPNPERLKRVHDLAVIMLRSMNDIDHLLNTLPLAESSWTKHFCEFDDSHVTEWGEAYDRTRAAEIAALISRLFKAHIEFRKHINLNSSYFARASDSSNLPAWDGTPAYHWHHYVQLRSGTCYNKLRHRADRFTLDNWRAFPLDQIELERLSVLLENAMFFRHFAHDFKELISDTERAKLERDLAGEYQKAVGQAQQAELLARLSSAPIPDKNTPDVLALTRDILRGKSLKLFDELLKHKHSVNYDTLRDVVWPDGDILDDSITTALERLKTKLFELAAPFDIEIRPRNSRAKFVDLRTK